ncbi:I78 family peptidase inhibitor [Luteimonas sp. e5]
MNKLHVLSAALAAATLSACNATPPTATEPAPEPVGQCNSEAVRSFLGKTITPEVGEQARIAAGAVRLRVLGPDDAMTMDYRMDRLNIYVNPERVAIKVTCG